MALFKAIEHGKEHRKPYSTKSMRRYGLWTMCCVIHNPKFCQCEICRDNRLYANKKRESAAEALLKEYEQS